MRLRTVLVTLVVAALVGAARGGMPEQEPNDDFSDPGFAGDLGALGSTPIVVDGTISTYGIEGDRDVYRFSLGTASRVSVVVRGFTGQLDAALLRATGEEFPATPIEDWGLAYFAGVEFSAGQWMVDLSGQIGASNDPYELTIREVSDAPLTIQKAKVKLNASKPDRDTGTATATFTAPGLDPAEDGLFLRFFGREWYVAPERFTAKKTKRLFKGAKGDFLKKVQFDLAKGTVKVKLGKGSLGVAGQDQEIDLYLESGGTACSDSVTPRASKNGQTLKYKAPKK